MEQKVGQGTWFTDRQKKFLAVVSQEKNFKDKFYLTGGTALTAVYYNHRYSQDLDFFSAHEFTSPEVGYMLSRTIKKLGWVGIRQNINYPVNMYVLTWADGYSLKLDFTFFAFDRLQIGKQVLGVEIDSIPDIAVNKLEAILGRKEARDYVDLYTIMTHEKINILDIYKLHLEKVGYKIDNLALARLLISVREVSNYPKMKVPFNKEEMFTFFEKEAKTLESQIFTA